jgi:hypothetical protein
VSRKEILTRYRSLLEERRFLGTRRAELAQKLLADLRSGAPGTSALRISRADGCIVGIAFLSGDSFRIEAPPSYPYDSSGWWLGPDWVRTTERTKEVDQELSDLEAAEALGLPPHERYRTVEALRRESGYID